MTIKKRNLVLLVLTGVAIGWFTLGGSAAVMNYTSKTEFCLSCHSMSIPYEEYQGSIHFSNAKGIRAECADCHIPSQPIDYLVTKIRASKDIFHEYVTGKIDTEEKYEQHRIAMAETVWEQLRANDSATCRSCHTFDAMDNYEQSEDAAKMHEYAQKNQQTCIDCHKGVAHFAPEPEMDSEAYDNLIAFTQNTSPDATFVYPIEPVTIDDIGTINPTTQLKVLTNKQGKRKIELSAYQMKGAEQVLYLDKGKRAIVAMLSEQGQAGLEVGQFETDEYDNQWRTAKLTTEIDAPVLDSQQPIWDYAEQLDTVYCSTCHAKIPANHYTVNAWGPVAKGMGERTDISAADLELLTKFFQNHAKDVAGH